MGKGDSRLSRKIKRSRAKKKRKARDKRVREEKHKARTGDDK